MNYSLKPLQQQVLVITGASSGIGLTTARMAANRGVRGLVLVSRSAQALALLEREINRMGNGTQAIAVPCDVADAGCMRKVAATATEHFGGFDTWVNNAGASIYGRITEISEEDHRKLFETNYWGMVNGSLIAAEHLRSRGGCLINIGSTVSERSIPVQGMYAASKHAVKGFTDALRMELEETGEPIAVTLIKPGSIDTPFTSHAKNYMEDAPGLPPPVYAPELVAETILYAAEHPVRDLFVGGGGKGFQIGEKLAPRALDKYMETVVTRQMHSGRPRNDVEGFYYGSNDMRERGDYEGTVRRHSLYTSTVTHPGLSLGAVAGVGLLLGGLSWLMQRQRSAPAERPHGPYGVSRSLLSQAKSDAFAL